MLSLPPVELLFEEGRFVLVLPCPDLDVLNLLAHRIAGSAEVDSECTVELLADNPSLLSLSAIQFASQRQRPADSMSELARWLIIDCNPPISEALVNCEWIDNHARRKKILKRIKRYLASCEKKEILDSLRRFMSSLKASTETELGVKVFDGVDLPLSDPILDEISDRNRQRSKKRNRLILGRWQGDGLTRVACQRFLSAFERLECLEQNFQQVLHQEKLASLKQLAYGASHEINNPLANIATRAQTLLIEESNIERRFKLGIIYEQAIRSHEMISDLMLFANPPVLNRQPVDVRELLRQINNQVTAGLSPITRSENNGQANRRILDSITAAPQKKFIHFSIRLAPGLHQIECDPVQLSVALHALIRNAIESVESSRGNQVQLRASCADPFLEFSVIDDGNGVAESIRSHLFDPFFSGREAGRGLGFGLSKAWRIAQLHEGDLRLDDSYPSGARFVLRIPIKTAAPNQ